MRTATVVLAAMLAVSAQADPLEVLVCYPSAAISGRDAEPALKEMVGVIESIGGWPAGTVRTHFTTRLAECQQKLDSLQPSFAILPLGTYLRNRQAHQLEPLVQPRIDGSNDEYFHVVVRKESFANLEQLKGKKLGGPWLGDVDFLRRVVFAGKLDPQKDMELVPAKRALKALKQLHAKKLDAVLLNRQQTKSISALPFGKELQIIFSSEALPQVGIAADIRRVPEADRVKMQKAMEAMCAHQKGKKLCELFNIEGFVKANPDTYARVINLWQSVP